MESNIIGYASLQDYYLSGNIPDILIMTPDPIEISIQLVATDGFTITELHEPEINESVLISIRNLIHDHLSTRFDYEFIKYITTDFQTFAVGQVIITPEGQTQKSFRVVRGNIDADPYYNYKSFLEDNFLNTCPQIKHVLPNAANVLNYYFFSESKIILKATILTGYDLNDDPEYITETFEYVVLSANNWLATINIKYSLLASKFTISPEHTIVYIDVHALNIATSKTTFPIRFMPKHKLTLHEDIFAFENSLGGIDTIAFTGVLSENLNHDYLSFVNKNTRYEFKTIHKQEYTKNTGFFTSDEDILFIDNFLRSANKYHIVNDVAKRIYITGMKAEKSKGKLNSYTFSFSYANQQAPITITRQEEL